jgi:hypothetical protein
LRSPVVAISAIAVVLTAPVAQASDDKPTVLSTVMTGAAEVPGPGDPDGRGFFAAAVKGNQLCYVIAANRIEPGSRGT